MTSTEILAEQLGCGAAETAQAKHALWVGMLVAALSRPNPRMAARWLLLEARHDNAMAGLLQRATEPVAQGPVN